MSRYAQPRKLTTKRAETKFERNAWCLIHRKPMQKHGKNWTCPGHWSTRMQAVGKDFAARSLAITGWTRRYEGARHTYPHCVNCKIRMERRSRRSTGEVMSYRCRLCRAITGSRMAPGRFANSERERQTGEMIRTGYSNNQIISRLKVHHTRVSKLRSEIPDDEIAKCICGKIKLHSTGCDVRRDVRTVLAQNRSEFDNLRVKISRSLPKVPAEYREDAIQDVIAVILEATNQMVANLTKYRLPWQFTLNDTVEG